MGCHINAGIRELRIFENEMLKNIRALEAGVDGELHNLYSSPSCFKGGGIGENKVGGQAACMGEEKGMQVLQGKLERETLFRKPGH